MSPLPRQPLLDVEKLVRLRVAAGLSQRELGRRVGLSPVAISALERPGATNHGDLSLRTLSRVAGVLGVEPFTLLRGGEMEPCEARSTDDDIKVEAILAEVGNVLTQTDLAIALGWELDRVEMATARLRKRLAGTGQRLCEVQGLKLGARREEFSEEEVGRVREMAVKSDGRGFDLGCARLLRRVLDNEVDSAWEARASNPERVALRRLVKLGLIRKQHERWQVESSVEFSFQLSASPA